MITYDIILAWLLDHFVYTQNNSEFNRLLLTMGRPLKPETEVNIGVSGGMIGGHIFEIVCREVEEEFGIEYLIYNLQEIRDYQSALEDDEKYYGRIHIHVSEMTKQVARSMLQHYLEKRLPTKGF